MGSRMRTLAGRCVFSSVRILERALPPAALRASLLPLASCLARLDLARIGGPRRANAMERLLPDAGNCTKTAFLEGRRRFHLQRALLNLPDRFTEPAWRDRFRMDGSDRLEAAIQSPKPVVLVTLHHGTHMILRYALRAMGYPIATLVSERLQDRSALKRRKDSLSDFPSVPGVFSGHFPKAAIRFLRNNGTLIAMLDHAQGRMLHVPIPGGTWRVSSTPFRIARAARACVLPVLIHEESPWQFLIRIGNPLPTGLLAREKDFPAAAQFLWQEYLPSLNASAWDSYAELFDSLSLDSSPESAT